MPYTVEWLVPQQIIDVKVDKIFTADEAASYDDHLTAWLDEGQSKKVNILVDITELQQFPSLKQGRQMTHIQHPNFGWVVVYGDVSPLLKTIGLLLANFFGNRLHWCNNRAEALVFLRRMDNTLPENIETS